MRQGVGRNSVRRRGGGVEGERKHCGLSCSRGRYAPGAQRRRRITPTTTSSVDGEGQHRDQQEGYRLARHVESSKHCVQCSASSSFSEDERDVRTGRRVSAALVAALLYAIGGNDGSSKAVAAVAEGGAAPTSKSTVASLSAGGALGKATTKTVGQIAGLGIAAGAAAVYSSISSRGDPEGVTKTNKAFNEERKALSAPKALVQDSSSPPEGESLSEAAAEAAAEAAKAAGQATALAAMTQVASASSDGSDGEDGVEERIALEEARRCVAAALDSSSEQTKLAVLDLAETLLNRLEKKDEEIQHLQSKMITSAEVTKSVQEIRESTNKRLSELFGDMDKLKAKLREIVGERDALRERVAAMESSEEEMSALQNQLTTEKDGRMELEKELRTIQENLQGSEASQQDMIASLRKDLSAAQEESTSLKERESTMEVAEREASGLQNKISEAESTVAKLKADLEEEIIQNDTLKESNDTMMNQLATLEAELSGAASNSEEVQKLLKENQQLSDSIQEMSEDITLVTELKEEVTALKEKSAKLQIKADNGHKLLFESNSSNNALKESVERLEQKLGEEERLSSEREGLLNAKEAELEKALKVVAELKEHLSETHERNQELETTCSRMKSELEANNNNLSLELKEREKEVLEMNDLLKRLKGSNEQVEDLKAQLIQTRADYATQQTLAEGHKKVETGLRAEIESLEQRLEAAESSNTNDSAVTQDEFDEAKEALAESMQNNKAKDEIIERLELKLSQSDNLIQELEKKSSGLQESNSQYEHLISELEENIQSLDERMKDDAGKMEELNQLKTQMANYSDEAAEADNLREFIKEQKIQFQEQQQVLKDQANAKEEKARALTTLITDLHSLLSRLN